MRGDQGVSQLAHTPASGSRTLETSPEKRFERSQRAKIPLWRRGLPIAQRHSECLHSSFSNGTRSRIIAVGRKPSASSIGSFCHVGAIRNQVRSEGETCSSSWM